ncbi:metallopeptidase TldD-related protein [Elusimicrobiota bacterium]
MKPKIPHRVLGLLGVLGLFISIYCSLLTSRVLGQEDVNDVFQAEIARSMKNLRFKDWPKPYFIELRLIKTETHLLSLRNARKVYENKSEETILVPRVRVGSYKVDETPDSWANTAKTWPIVTPEDQPRIARHYIWQAIDDAYKTSSAMFFEKKAKRSSEGIPDYVTDDFAKQEPIRHVAKSADVKTWEAFEKYSQRAQEISSLIGTGPRILRSLVNLRAERIEEKTANSEGSSITSNRTQAQLYLSLYGLSDIGLPVHMTKSIYGKTFNELPRSEDLKTSIKVMKEDFFNTLASSEARSGIAPCLLDPAASAQVFLAFIERLEGARQRDPDEPQTFRERIGKKVLPDFISITDDPTATAFKQTALFGHYTLDDEGVRAEKVSLIDKGVLKNFLLSRRPVKGFLARSNGHGRASPQSIAHARAGNLFVTSEKTLKVADMKAMLIQELKTRQLPFGLIISGLKPVGGNQKRGAHQAFRAVPDVLRLVFQDGRQELVHNTEIIATPIRLMESILAAGDDYKAVNMLAGGISGSVPTSVIIPSFLVGEVEVQKGKATKIRQHILKSPLE